MGERLGVVGVDVGTTSVKAMVVGADASVIGAARSDDITALRPVPGHVEQDPAEIWSATKQAMRAALDQSDGGCRVVGVALAAQSGSVVRLDPSGEPIGRVVTWMDRRSDDLVADWTATSTATLIKSLTGWAPSSGLGTLAWFHKRRDGSGSTDVAPASIGGVDSLIIRHLTRSWTTNPSNAAGLQLMDLASGDWSEEVAAIAGVDVAALPDLSEAGEPIGRVHAEAAHATGLPATAAVFSGGHDQTCTALAVGVSRPGQLLLAGGTAWVLTSVTGSPQVPVGEYTNVSRHVIRGRWTRSRLLGDFGAALHRVTADESADRLLDTLDAGRDTVPPGAADPFFVGGAFVDENGTPVHPPVRQRAVAVMEAAAMTLAEALPTDSSAEPVTLVGGITSGDLWPQLLADISGRVMVTSISPSWPAMGAALLAGGGAGLFDPVAVAESGLRKRSRTIAPRPDQWEGYRRRANMFRRFTKESQA